MAKTCCLFPGCDTLAGCKKSGARTSWQGYCVAHAHTMRACVIDGCVNMVASWNRSGCCKDHRAEGRKLRP